MTTMTRPRSRPVEPQTARIDAEATALAAQAEITLLRKLLDRCDTYLESVAQEARMDGVPDAYAEDLRRDILLVLCDYPDVDDTTDRRLGAIEVPQQARAARCAVCLDRPRRDVAIARPVRQWWAAVALLAVVLAVAIAWSHA